MAAEELVVRQSLFEFGKCFAGHVLFGGGVNDGRAVLALDEDDIVSVDQAHAVFVAQQQLGAVGNLLGLLHWLGHFPGAQVFNALQGFSNALDLKGFYEVVKSVKLKASLRYSSCAVAKMMKILGSMS